MLAPVSKNSSPFKKVHPSNRIDYFKVNLTPSEFKVFDLKTKRVQAFFVDKNLTYNQVEFFRTLILNFDNPELMNLMSKLYASDVSPIFKRTSL